MSNKIVRPLSAWTLNQKLLTLTLRLYITMALIGKHQFPMQSVVTFRWKEWRWGYWGYRRHSQQPWGPGRKRELQVTEKFHNSISHLAVWNRPWVKRGSHKLIQAVLSARVSPNHPESNQYCLAISVQLRIKLLTNPPYEAQFPFKAIPSNLPQSRSPNETEFPHPDIS